MRKFAIYAAGAAVALASSLALADTALSDPESLPKVPCTDFKYSADFLRLYPRAPAACLEGRELNGVRWARFDARVFLTGPDFTTVRLLNRAGHTLDTFSFKAPDSAQILMNGHPEPLSGVRRGQRITFWVPEHHLEAHGLLSSTDEAWRVLPPRAEGSSGDKAKDASSTEK